MANFRNLVDQKIDFSSGANWLVGRNGQGKTNLLEAVYLVLTTKSFRTPFLRDLVGRRGAGFDVRARLNVSAGRHLMALAFGKGSKLRQIDGKNSDILDYLEKGCVIAFTARSKEVVQGPPETRRLFLDRMVANFDKQHIVDLGRHRKNLQQLKRLVYQRRDLFAYRSFKAASTKVAHRITRRRQEHLAGWADKAEKILHEVFGYNGRFRLRYRVRNAGSEPYEKRMLSLCAGELLHGRMLMGPQLDDLEVVFNGLPMRQTGSSGQVRAIVLSLKLAIRREFFHRFGEWPILILDDIDAELDNERISKLLEYVSEGGQTLISSSKYGTIRGHLMHDIFRVADGEVIPERTAG